MFLWLCHTLSFQDQCWMLQLLGPREAGLWISFCPLLLGHFAAGSLSCLSVRLAAPVPRLFLGILDLPVESKLGHRAKQTSNRQRIDDSSASPDQRRRRRRPGKGIGDSFSIYR